MNRRFKAFAFPYVIWMLIFIVVPLLMIVLYSFAPKDFLINKDFEFTFENYNQIFQKGILESIMRSFYYALLCTIICLILGYPMAFIISRSEPSKRNIMLMFFLVPIWMNFLLRTYAWMTILSRNGVINTILKAIGFNGLELMPGPGAVLLGMVYNFLPFMVLPIYTVLRKIDRRVLEAAKDLGADNKRVFLKVIMPLSIPGIVSGITMVFMPAVSTFVISNLLGGRKEVLIGNLIERRFTTELNWGVGSSLSIILMILILISMAIMTKVDKQPEGGKQ